MLTDETTKCSLVGMDSLCTFEGCGRSTYAKHLCNSHYMQDYRGQELKELRPFRLVNLTDSEKLEVKIARAQEEGKGDCWIWPDKPNREGYGVMVYYGKKYQAHRLVYTRTGRAIRENMLLDHTCYVRNCVNPEHLRPVTNKQNMENRKGAQVNSRSGVRGVCWDSRTGKWYPSVTHNGKNYKGKLTDSIAEAEIEVKAMRNRLFTHNDLDRP